MSIELTQPSAEQSHAPTALSNDGEAARQNATDCGAFGSNALPSLPPQTSAVASPAGHAGNVLSPAQQTAIALLVAGRSAASVAATLGMHRGTISRWRTHHPLFAAELARRQRDVYDTASRRLQLMMVKAIGVIDTMLRTPAYQQDAAWKVLSGLRAASWAKPLPATDAETQEWPDDLVAPPPSCQPASADVISPGTTSV